METAIESEKMAIKAARSRNASVRPRSRASVNIVNNRDASRASIAPAVNETRSPISSA